MWLLAKLKEMLEDGGKGSFGRITAIPFLVSSWLIATTYGGLLLYRGFKALSVKDYTGPSGEAVMDVVWGLALIAAMIYGGSKGLSVVRGGTTIKTDNSKGTEGQ